MGLDTDAAREVAKTNFKATVLSAALGCIGVILAAWIGAGVGRSQGRAEVKHEVTQQDAQLADRDKQIAQLRSDLQALRQQPPSSPGEPLLHPLNASQAWRDPQHTEYFTITLKSCSRKSETIDCEFSIVADQRDSRAQLWGRSRLIDRDGKQWLARGISLAGRNHRMDQQDFVSEDLVRGIAVSGAISFEGLPTDQTSAPVIEFVMTGARVQFRDVPFA